MTDRSVESAAAWRLVSIGFAGIIVSYLLSSWRYHPIYAIPEIASNITVFYGLTCLNRINRQARQELRRMERQELLQQQAEFMALWQSVWQSAAVGLVVEGEDQTTASIVVNGEKADLASLPIDDDLRARAQTWLASCRAEKLPSAPGGGDLTWQAEGRALLDELYGALTSVDPVEKADQSGGDRHG